MVFEGFKFGMLLQMAIGPMALLVFNTAGSAGILPGLLAATGVAAADAICIVLAGTGLSVFLKGERTRKVFLAFGSVVLVAFGANIFLGAFGRAFIPAIGLFSAGQGAGHFLKGLLLALSNPLTIVFWGGVFSAKVSTDSITGRQMALFGFGCVLSTISALGLTAMLGAFAGSFIPARLMSVLNAAVGLYLIYMGIKLPFAKAGREKAGEGRA